MPRRRWMQLVAILLVVVGAGGGYWLTHRDPDPVLRTIVLPWAQPDLFHLEEGEGRLYFATNNGGNRHLSIINTRSGNPVELSGALDSVPGLPLVDFRSDHYFDSDQANTNFLMIDRATDAVLTAIPIPSGWWSDALDTARDRLMLALEVTPDVLVIDGHSGRVLRDLQGCTTSTGPVINLQADRIFELCEDGSVLVLEYRSYRQLAVLRDARSTVGSCRFCWATVDEATQRLFVPGSDGVSVLDARTGALVRALPITSRGGGTLDFLPSSHDVVVVPYQDPSLGPPVRSVVVLDGRTGAVAHRWAVPENPTQALMNPLTGHLLVASAGPLDTTADPEGYGTLSVLDARTGAILRQVETGIFPGQIAADSRTRHLFVVNFDTSMDDQLSPLSRHYSDGLWPRFLRWLKGLASWLPFTAPQQPPPPGTVTVTMLDLTRL